jgi:hypothetical protein
MSVCHTNLVRAGRLILLAVMLAPASRTRAQELPVTPGPAATAPRQLRIDFNRDVRPILSDTCFKCHGPDPAHREAKLSLVTREDATAPREGGPAAVVPGKPGDSEAYRRLIIDDPKKRMPPADSGLTLTPAQVNTLKRWIEQGAEYQRHWAFIPPVAPPLPEVGDAAWCRNPIDRFVLARLDREGLQPAPEASRETLIRRASLDLTGLPPTPAEADAFLADASPDAYEKVIDRLLASPRYGERMAQAWLDAARFADTAGYQADWERSMWPWRDWVVRAFNANMPFDQFTVEQLAGDMLPAPTAQQLLATGFNRNHRINDEGGIIPEEYAVEYVIDRVETTAAVWLGMTAGCARCHDHKYDPLTQREFYRLYAYFNNVPEIGQDGRKGYAEPHLVVQTPGVGGPEGTPVMVMRELPTPRDTYLLKRGAYDQPDKSEKLTPGIPAALTGGGVGVTSPSPGTPGEGRGEGLPTAENPGPSPNPLPAYRERATNPEPRNRLELARWLVDPDNPLTARVTVNRFWQNVFGTGLVKTSEDFGAQGEWPSHPELLDWLATEFVRTGWDVKAFHKLIATSATYRQSSRVTPALFERDPENRLLARGARYRLDAHAVRDNALSIGGLLVEKLGGPPVKPYQPPGLWEELSFGNGKTTIDKYVQDTGEKLYRRTLYTFWKRTVPPPALAIFDAAGREACTVRLGRTNTPLQALNLLNDVTYVEAARKLAERMLRDGGSTPSDRLTHGFRLATARRPTDRELTSLLRGFEQYAATYRADPIGAAALLGVGESPRDAALDAGELAAYTASANVLLNLDETMTRE